ncbi:hypothetical protein B0H13DRAFT_2357179 [Mycena leptocephala]|nr:hypothetical protein B0H13DRAFT_2357179 [Mycena leptocephala]
MQLRNLLSAVSLFLAVLTLQANAAAAAARTDTPRSLCTVGGVLVMILQHLRRG